MTAFDNALTVVVVAAIVGWTISTVARLYFRSRNIQAHGWPPPHLDADGDVHPTCDCQREPEPDVIEQGVIRT